MYKQYDFLDVLSHGRVLPKPIYELMIWVYNQAFCIYIYIHQMLYCLCTWSLVPSSFGDLHGNKPLHHQTDILPSSHHSCNGWPQNCQKLLCYRCKIRNWEKIRVKLPWKVFAWFVPEKVVQHWIPIYRHIKSCIFSHACAQAVGAETCGLYSQTCVCPWQDSDTCTCQPMLACDSPWLMGFRNQIKEQVLKYIKIDHNHACSCI